MSAGADAQTWVRERYRRFGDVEAVSSPPYRRLAHAVADDPDVTALLAALPVAHRRPNLLFGVMRLAGVDVTAPATALRWVREHAGDVVAELATRRTQTNEVARAALLLPALARLPEPLALVDAGASAGLGLLLDRWRYRYTRAGAPEHVVEPAPGPAGAEGAEGAEAAEKAAALTISCAVSGPAARSAPLPARVPRITWRAGLDAHPLDARDPGDRAWLRALVWPGHDGRARDLDAALDVAAAVGPTVATGDVVDDLAATLAGAPQGATRVVVHSVVLTYLEPERRERFRHEVAALGAHRVGLEHAGVLPHLDAGVPAGTAATDRVVLSLDDHVLALANGHGGELVLGP